MALRHGVGIVSVAALIGAGFTLVAMRGGIATRDDGSFGPRVSDDVLVFDDGYDGIVALDLGAQVVTRRPVRGQAPGDQPFRSLLVGDHLVVGRGDVYAVPLRGGRSRRLGAGVAVPAAEPGTVWLTSYGSVHTASERLVNMRGTVLLEGATPRDERGAFPAAAGVRGGLVFETADGLAIWDARAGKIVRRIGSPGSVAGPVYRSMIAWCARCGSGLELTTVSDAGTRAVPVPGGATRFRIADAAFSRDGARLAVPVEVDDGRTDVVIVDVGIAAITARLSGWASPFVSVAWSPDSKRLYIAAAGGDGTAADRQLVVYDPATDSQRELGAAPNEATRFVVVTRDVARGMLADAPLGAAEVCLPPAVQPNGRNGACAFRY